ncbi:MAG: hypothetical protein R3C12_06320 [Planctomycetaceae bacterium]|nr:hypothetical protein [Planctomycetaceae bacterium]
MFFGMYYYWILLAPLLLIIVGVILIGVYALTGNLLIDLLGVLFNRGAKLTCWHCGRETAADRKTCQHCGEELQ